MIKKQFTLYLRNKPGELAQIAKKLGKSNINIEGLSVAAAPDVALVQLVASNATVARRVFKENKIPYTSQDVILIPLQNVPGSLARVLDRLAKEKLNINYVYATASQGAGCEESFAVISAPDLKKVEKVWEELQNKARL